MKLFLLITGLIALGVFGMAVKIIFKKDGKFDKTCASASRIFDEEEGAEGHCRRGIRLINRATRRLRVSF